LIRTIEFSDRIKHISKASEHHIDVYGDHLTTYAPQWHVETWKRGHHITGPKGITEISQITILDTTFKESQDHSKWAVSDTQYWVGDLNRMTTQMKRGGGGFLIQHHGVVNSLKSSIVA
jgi:hypothetical protein